MRSNSTDVGHEGVITGYEVLAFVPLLLIPKESPSRNEDQLIYIHLHKYHLQHPMLSPKINKSGKLHQNSISKSTNIHLYYFTDNGLEFRKYGHIETKMTYKKSLKKVCKDEYDYGNTEHL
ncbi:hypothetical protein LAV72_19070 [Lysinibacillus xylanilyticus]|uniref:hypothetical protein n=1 Tax=Lysinibacillus xylanilyticus TaxID=582475 RepID=UPI002B2534A3|nr:hypothetical protein [Lysinibacillus xylanilyticus]MEB2301709.1 hypothetical protein [Lysinibacillus xylanilyticus]